MVRGPRPTAGLLVVALLIAGCVSPQETNDEQNDGSPELEFQVDWYERALPNDDEHSHHDRKHHANLSTPNFEIVAHDPLFTEHHGMNSGGNFCGDLESTNERTLAVTHSFTSDVAFILFDVTDPEEPFVVGELVMENTHIWDLALTPDQNHVVLATSQYGQQDEEQLPTLMPGEAPRMAYWDACTGTTRELAGPEAMAPYPSGIVLVDIEDPQAPVVTDYHSLPVLGGHSIVAEEIDGESLVLVTVSNIGRADYYVFYGIIDNPVGDKLDQYSIHYTQPEDGDQLARDLQEPFFMNHDGFLQEHPVTGDAIAYLADGQWGVTILNIDDPRSPQVIARWDEAAGIANSDYHFAHSILPIEGTWDGRHYTFFSEECTARQEETPSCLAYVLDTTDPSDPQLAGAWTFPHDMGGWSYPSFSPHYMALVNRTLFISSWHAGLWAIDVSTPETLRTMPSIGVFIPDIEVDHVPEGNYGYQYNQKPVVADVVSHGDHLVAFDGTSGAYVLKFDASQPAPAPEPWPLNLPE